MWVGMSRIGTTHPRSGKGTHRGVPLQPDPLTRAAPTLSLDGEGFIFAFSITETG